MFTKTPESEACRSFLYHQNGLLLKCNLSIRFLVVILQQLISEIKNKNFHAYYFIATLFSGQRMD